MDKNRKEIIQIGKLLWDKELVCGCSGNISLRTGKDSILITAHNCCLGMLSESDVILMDLEGNAQTEAQLSTEKYIHSAIYKHLPQSAVIHAHPAFTNGYFAQRDKLECLTYESRLLLGQVPCLRQETPSVTNIEQVIEALKNSNIVALKNHGVIAVGASLTEAFYLVQLLEDAVKVNAVAQLFSLNPTKAKKEENNSAPDIPKFEMFSDAHIRAIVDLVNKDEQFCNQAKSLGLRTKLAVKMEETGKTFCFTFEDGKITQVDKSEEGAEFVISAAQIYWRKIFNRELDPFVATTQKKLKLKGDFGKISRWYAAFNKLFEVWKKISVV